MRIIGFGLLLCGLALCWTNPSQAMHLCPGNRVPQLLKEGYSWPDVQRHCSKGTPLRSSPRQRQAPAYFPATPAPTTQRPPVQPRPPAPGGNARLQPAHGGVFSVYDDALRMKVGDYVVPAGWWVDHKVALETQNPANFFQYYLLDFWGPDGQYITQIPPRSFSPALGQTFENQWAQTLQQQLRHLGRYQTGAIVQSRLAQRLLPAPAQRGQVRSLEMPLKVYRKGRTFEGLSMAYLTYGQFTSMYSVVTAIAPAGSLRHALEVYEQIMRNQRKNPQYTARFNEIRQKLLQKYVVQSRKLYLARERSFQQFQAQMRAASAARSAQAAAFSRSLRSTGRGARAGNDGYTTNDQFNDYLKDSTSFKDPYSGYRVTQPGNFEYWYTDKLGHFIGTNDPNFNTSLLIGDWSRIEPLRP